MYSPMMLKTQVRAWIKTATVEMVKSFVAAYSESQVVFSCTVGPQDAIYLPAGYYFSEKVGTLGRCKHRHICLQCFGKHGSVNTPCLRPFGKDPVFTGPANTDSVRCIRKRASGKHPVLAGPQTQTQAKTPKHAT